MEIAGTIAVVTGASSGLGWYSSLALADRGATVVVAARRMDRLEELVQHIEQRDGRALAVRCDVAAPEQIEALAAEVDGAFGRCDILVNNAGLPGGGLFADRTPEEIERLVRVNILGVMHGCRVFLPMMLAAGRGHILNIASIAGRHAAPTAALYSSTKHAVSAFSESLSHELIDHGILVTSMNPGFAATEGFPQGDLPRHLVMRAGTVARAVVRAVERDAGPQITVPRWAGTLEVFRILGPLYWWGMRRLIKVRSRPSPTRPA
ncbi:MAG: SDR family NAD(P)-dependent oxidoreductase [Actinomycetota bacterium]